MPESRDDIQTALVYDKAATPTWELSAKAVAFPIEVDDGKKDFILGVYLEPYDGKELKKALNAEQDASYTAFMPILDRHFLRMDGVSSSDVDLQRKFLNGNFQLKTRIVKSGWGGVSIAEDDGAGTREVLNIDSVEDAPLEIVVAQRLWDLDLKSGVDVKMAHRFKPPTQAHFNRLMAALKPTPGRRGAPTIKVNYDVLEAIYNETAISVSGMTVSGQECSESNRSAWINLVPLWHKTLVITDLYRESRLKN